jgi:hypothetical protein
MEALQLISAFRVGVDNGVINCCEAFGLLEELMCVWLHPANAPRSLENYHKKFLLDLDLDLDESQSMFPLRPHREAEQKKKVPKKKG